MDVLRGAGAEFASGIKISTLAFLRRVARGVDKGGEEVAR